jgi:phospholipid/cholesterol/gamma-HCH transport system ATP-binding protein
MSICFEGVSKSFGSKHVLRDVSFKILAGEIVFILGKSGMGKSVTLKHIVGLLSPDAGKICVDSTYLEGLSASEISRVRKKCGMVFQHPALLDSLNVFQNVSFGLKNESNLEEKKSRVIEVLKLVHLDESILDLMPQEISYGMQKRVSLARTLAPKPNYLLFDEPTTGLDPITTNAINELILELSRKLNVTSLVVSHDMGCALRIADRILILDEGRILAFDTVEKIKEMAKDIELIDQFLKESL